MARRRRTKAERDQERYELEHREWEMFQPRLEAVQTFADALRLVDQSPRPDSPGRRYYSNLAFFLHSFTVPLGSNRAERQLYLQFIQRLDAAGALKPGASEKIIADLQQSIDQAIPW